MRKYALVIFDNKDKIVDRFNIDIASSASNNGFKVSLDTIESDVEDIITNISQDRLNVKFTIEQIENSYAKSNITRNWIQKYLRPEFTMALEYDDQSGNDKIYCIGKVTTLEKNDKIFTNVLQQVCVFQQTSSWFYKKENIIIYEESATGKKYSYTYPYAYGAGSVENNLIENGYIYDIPLNITINGAVTNPIVSLFKVTYNDDGNEVVASSPYNVVKLGTTSEPFIVGVKQELYINSAKRKITLLTYSDDEHKHFVEEIDVTNQVDPESDTFLRVDEGYSKIEYNKDTVDSHFKIIGSWRQYVL